MLHFLERVDFYCMLQVQIPIVNAMQNGSSCSTKVLILCIPIICAEICPRYHSRIVVELLVFVDDSFQLGGDVELQIDVHDTMMEEVT